MEENSRQADADAQQGESTEVPTAGQVLKRGLWAVVVTVAAFPLLAWWFMNDDPGTLDFLLLFLGGSLLCAGLQRITRPPRPRLGKGVNQAPLKEALTLAFENGSLPEDPLRRSRAGALACQEIEGMLYSVAVILGLILAALGKPTDTWIVVVGTLVLLTATNVTWARRSWRYLKTLHAGGRTT